VLAGKPGFTRVDMLGDRVQVGGASVPGDRAYEIHVTLLQDADGDGKPHTALTTLERPATDWEANFDSKGFAKGPCMVIGHEIQFDPQFSTHTWVQYMDIK
jgi:hypothetical protein